MKMTTSVALAALLMTGAANAATVTITDYDQSATTANVSGGATIAITNSSAELGTITISNIDLDGDTINDTFTFDLNTATTGTATEAVVLNGVGWGESGGNNDITTDEQLTFTVSNFNFTAGGGAATPMIAFDGFTGLLATRWGAGDSGTFGGSTQISDGSGADAKYTFAATNSLDATWEAGGFRVRGLDLGFTFTPNNVPEPSTAALIGLGGLGLILRRRK